MSRSFDESQTLRVQWDQLLLRVEGHLYSSYEWCRTWWDFYGKGRELRLVKFCAGGEVVGIVPMFIERLWCGLGCIRIAKLVGCDHSLSLCQVMIERSYLRDALASLVEHFVKIERCDAIWFGPVDGRDGASDAIREVCAHRSDLVNVVRDAVFAPHTVFLLPGHFAEFVASLSKRQRENHRRNTNLINKTFRISADVLRGAAEVEGEFDAFCAMHQRQWQAEGKAGHFGDWPDARSFNLALIRSLGPRSQVRLYRIKADDNVVSYQYGFRFGKCLYWRLPARASEAEWDRFGLGRVGLMSMLEMAIAEEVDEVEAGLGHYDYKVRLGGQEHAARSLLVIANRSASRWRARLFSAIADAIHLVYYRLWYLRLAPRLPIPQGPLLRSWIRSRM